MSDPQPRTGFLARFRRQDRTPDAGTPVPNSTAAEAESFVSALDDLAHASMAVGRYAAEVTWNDLDAGKTTADQVTTAAAERAAALDDAMHNLTVGDTLSSAAVRIATEAYGEWQGTSPAVTERAERLFAAAYEDLGRVPTSTLPEIAAAEDADRFHERARAGVQSGLRSAAATQDDLASGVIERADLNGVVDAVRDYVNEAVDRLERDPGSAGNAVWFAASGFAELGSATNAEALYAAAHETAGVTPVASLGEVLTEVTTTNAAAAAAADAEYGTGQAAPVDATAESDTARTSTGDLISLEVDQHVEQMTQTWVELAGEPGREVEAHTAYAALVTEVDNLKLDGTYLDPRAATGDRADALPTPVPEAVVEHLGDLESHLQSLEDQVVIYSGNAGPEWFDGEEPTPADPARVAAAQEQAESVRAELHQQLDEHGLTGTQWDPRTRLADTALTSTGDRVALEGDQHVNAPNETHAAPSTTDTAAPAVEQKRVSSYPMDVSSSLRHAAASHADPAAPSTGPSRPTSSTQRGGGIER